jgi:hypothetical protein
MIYNEILFYLLVLCYQHSADAEFSVGLFFLPIPPCVPLLEMEQTRL